MATPRPYFNVSYYDLEEQFQAETSKYLDFLHSLHGELTHRKKPWPVELRGRVEKQLARLEDGISGIRGSFGEKK